MNARCHLFVAALFLLAQCKRPEPESRLKLEEITIDQIQSAYRNGHYTVREIVEAYLERIENVDKQGPALNSIIRVNPDALSIADALDLELKNGAARGPLHGIPIVLKDNIDTFDKMPNTAGAMPMAGSMPPKDAFIVERLRESGAVIIAKANLSEWANFHSSFSSSGWSPLGGQTLNPYDRTRSPCGSSAGSGVAVAANLAVVAIGTETNGSITCPSSANGIVGIKPTVGLLSRAGIIPISVSQDTAGPMARTVRDAAIALGAMTGIDPEDAKTIASEDNYQADYASFLNSDGLDGKRLGIYADPLGKHFRVDALFERAVEFMETNGAELVEIDSLISEDVSQESFDVLLYEFKDGLNAYFKSLGPNAPVASLEELIEKTLSSPEEMRYFDHELLKKAQSKGPLSDSEYVQALQAVQTAYRRDGIDRAMNELDLDAIIAPTRGPAWKIDLTLGDNSRGVSSSSPAARAGYPSVTVPMGFIDGLPVNISFFGRAWSEPELLEIAYAYEQGTRHRKTPELP